MSGRNEEVMEVEAGVTMIDVVVEGPELHWYHRDTKDWTMQGTGQQRFRLRTQGSCRPDANNLGEASTIYWNNFWTRHPNEHHNKTSVVHAEPVVMIRACQKNLQQARRVQQTILKAVNPEAPMKLATLNNHRRG
jgi:hypothetical protein